MANVQDFGTVGDGSHDDQPNIQDAVDSLKDTGGVVAFPPGVYLVDREVVVGRGVMLLGTSHYVVRNYQDADRGSAIIGKSQSWDTGEALVVFDYNDEASNADDAMASGATNMAFRGLGTGGSPAVHGALAYGGRDFYFERCVFARNSRTGLRIQGDSGRSAFGNRSMITNCRAVFNADRGIYHSGGDRTFVGNVCAQNGLHGLHAISTHSITGGHYANDGGHGILVRDECSVSGVSCHDNDRSGLRITGINNAASGIAAYGNGHAPQDAADASGVQVSETGNAVAAVSYRAMGDHGVESQVFSLWSSEPVEIAAIAGPTQVP